MDPYQTVPLREVGPEPTMSSQASVSKYLEARFDACVCCFPQGTNLHVILQSISLADIKSSTLLQNLIVYS